jgi:hypothetical protein
MVDYGKKSYSEEELLYTPICYVDVDIFTNRYKIGEKALTDGCSVNI